MVKKHESPAVVVEPTPVPKQQFFFPTVGNGVTILAVSQQEANELIKQHPLFKS